MTIVDPDRLYSAFCLFIYAFVSSLSPFDVNWGQETLPS